MEEKDTCSIKVSVEYTISELTVGSGYAPGTKPKPLKTMSFPSFSLEEELLVPMNQTSEYKMKQASFLFERIVAFLYMSHGFPVEATGRIEIQSPKTIFPLSNQRLDINPIFPLVIQYEIQNKKPINLSPFLIQRHTLTKEMLNKIKYHNEADIWMRLYHMGAHSNHLDRILNSWRILESMGAQLITQNLNEMKKIVLEQNEQLIFELDAYKLDYYVANQLKSTKLGEQTGFAKPIMDMDKVMIALDKYEVNYNEKELRGIKDLRNYITHGNITPEVLDESLALDNNPGNTLMSYALDAIWKYNEIHHSISRPNDIFEYYKLRK